MPFFDHYSATEPTRLGRSVEERKIRRDFELMVSLLDTRICAPILEIGPGRAPLGEPIDLPTPVRRDGARLPHIKANNININAS